MISEIRRTLQTVAEDIHETDDEEIHLRALQRFYQSTHKKISPPKKSICK